jgi:hypothetical protein
VDCSGLVNIRQGHEILLWSTVSRLVQGSTHPSIQWVSGALSTGVKGPYREADHSPPSSAEVKNGGIIPPFPIRLLAVVVN